MSDDRGSVVTVDTPIDPQDLGITLPHEHLLLDATGAWFEPPSSAYDRMLSREPVSLETLWWVRRHAEQSAANLRLDSLEEAIDEVQRFQVAGGGTVVDVTHKHIGGDPVRVRQISRRTGLQIVHGTGYYIRAARPPRIDI